MKKLLLLSLLIAAPASAQQLVKLPAQDKALTGKPAVQFSIGAEDGEDWELLSRVTQVAFDREENLYVLDGGNNRVLVFNPQGKFVRKFGKKGGGPGELMAPVGVTITPEGQVAVSDLGRGAISLFKKDGTFLKNITLGDDYGFPVAFQGICAHPKDGIVLRTMPPRLQRGSLDQITRTVETNRKSPITWVSAADKRTKLFDIPLPDVKPKVQDNGGGQGARQVAIRYQIPAFTAPTLWGVLPNGNVVTSYDDEYKLRISNNGKVERIIERPFQPRKTTDADKAREKERRREQMANGSGMMVMATSERRGSGAATSSRGLGGPMSKAQIDEMLADLTFAETVPVLSAMYVDPTGRLWVRRNPPRGGDDGPIDLISPDGRYIGTVSGERMPSAVSLGGRAAYIERDDMDVEKVVVRRLPANWK